MLCGSPLWLQVGYRKACNAQHRGAATVLCRSSRAGSLAEHLGQVVEDLALPLLTWKGWAWSSPRGRALGGAPRRGEPPHGPPGGAGGGPVGDAGANLALSEVVVQQNTRYIEVLQRELLRSPARPCVPWPSCRGLTAIAGGPSVGSSGCCGCAVPSGPSECWRPGVAAGFTAVCTCWTTCSGALRIRVCSCWCSSRRAPCSPGSGGRERSAVAGGAPALRLLGPPGAPGRRAPPVARRPRRAAGKQVRRPEEVERRAAALRRVLGRRWLRAPGSQGKGGGGRLIHRRPCGRVMGAKAGSALRQFRRRSPGAPRSQQCWPASL